MAGLDSNTKLLLHFDGADGLRTAYAHFKCNDNAASTTVTDDGSGGNNGTSSTNTSNLSTTGKVNEAFDLVASNSEYFESAGAGSGIASDTTGSLSFWVYPTADDSNYYVSIADKSAYEFLYVRRLATNDKIAVHCYLGVTNSWQWQTADNTCPINTWTHVTVVQNGTSPSVYINGSVSGSLTTSDDTTTWLADVTAVDAFIVGAYYNSGYTGYPDARVDDIRYYKWVLTSDDVSTLYNGGDGTEATLIEDASGNHTDIVSYNTAQLDSSPFYTTTVASFNGSSSYVSMADSADWDFVGNNTDSKTVECWFKLKATTSATLFSHYEANTDHWRVFYASGSGFKFYCEHTGGTGSIDSGYGGTVDAGLWHHLALVKVADEYAIYIDGQQVNYVQDSDTDTFSGLFYIGQKGNSTEWVDGFMSEIRYYVGNPFSASPTSGETDTITVPTSPHTSDSNTKLLLHLDKNFDDDGNTGHTIQNSNVTFDKPGRFGGSSLVLDGNSDYLTLPDSADWDIGASSSSNWVVDGWFNFNSVGANQYLICQFEDGNNTWSLVYNTGTSSQFVFVSGGVAKINMAGPVLYTDRWYHLAVCKLGELWGLYIDGIQVAYDTTSDTDTFSTILTIGRRPDGTRYFSGNADELRIQNSDYFSSAPLPEPYAWYRLNEVKTSNTNVRDDGSGANDGTASTNTTNLGDTQGKAIGQLGTAGHTNGTDPNGTTECSVANDTSLDLSSSTDWTIEMRIQWHQAAANCYWMIGRWDSGNRQWFMVLSNGTTSTGYLRFAYTTDGSSNVNVDFGKSAGDFVPILEKWYHIAMVRTGGYIYAYIDGKLYGTPHYIGTTNFYGGSSAVRFPSSLTTYGASTHCSFEEVRVSKGIARWTDEFDVPTTQYTSDANTSLLVHADGSIVDSSSNGHTVTTTDVGLGGYDFNGSSEYIECDALSADIKTDTVGSVSMWINPDSSHKAVLFSIGDTDADSYFMIRTNLTGTNFEFAVRSSAGNDEWRGTAGTTTTSWQHIVLVQDGTAPKFYIDGVEKTITFSASADLTAWMNDATNIDNGMIGCSDWAGDGKLNFFNGIMDDFRYYQGVALTADQVAKIYNDGNGRTEPQDTIDVPTEEYSEDAVGYSQGVIIV